jgi:hypothetical protein
MNDFDKSVLEMDDNTMSTFGQKAILNNSFSVDVVIDLDVEQFGGFDTTGQARRHEVSFLSASMPEPKRGHTLEIEAGKFVFDGQISNDGHISRWHLNES